MRIDGDDGTAQITVQNGGKPIPEPLLRTMFEPMQRGVAQVDKARRSVGLGLYIVKHIVAAHGGSISVESSVAEGTRFSVVLPRYGTVENRN